ncbi:MAG: hypothetical protein OXE55_04940 [Flavobacteriaceae bacterium]|nr:hypothetical protein [Flavobacteriaceae bacterium]
MDGQQTTYVQNLLSYSFPKEKRKLIKTITKSDIYLIQEIKAIVQDYQKLDSNRPILQWRLKSVSTTSVVEPFLLVVISFISVTNPKSSTAFKDSHSSSNVWVLGTYVCDPRWHGLV